MDEFKKRERERFCGLLAGYVCRNRDICLGDCDKEDDDCKEAYEKAENFYDNYMDEFTD